MEEAQLRYISSTSCLHPGHVFQAPGIFLAVELVGKVLAVPYVGQGQHRIKAVVAAVAVLKALFQRAGQAEPSQTFLERGPRPAPFRPRPASGIRCPQRSRLLPEQGSPPGSRVRSPSAAVRQQQRRQQAPQFTRHILLIPFPGSGAWSAPPACCSRFYICPLYIIS